MSLSEGKNPLHGVTRCVVIGWIERFELRADCAACHCPLGIAIAPRIADCLQSGASRLNRPLRRGTVLPPASLYRPVRTGPARITGFDDTGMTILAFVKKFHNSPIFDKPHNGTNSVRGTPAEGLQTVCGKRGVRGRAPRFRR
ncbi:hypothetical protein [Paraburkholderia mimosarum]|uniref:hypothetical protein n=1 Tax=Paraburkholderia mimosarum TaxID=312026 RepID=UPI0012DE0E10|nr:hypothetical protein [Paraburkholderia mimosarum]